VGQIAENLQVHELLILASFASWRSPLSKIPGVVTRHDVVPYDQAVLVRAARVLSAGSPHAFANGESSQAGLSCSPAGSAFATWRGGSRRGGSRRGGSRRGGSRLAGSSTTFPPRACGALPACLSSAPHARAHTIAPNPRLRPWKLFRIFLRFVTESSYGKLCWVFVLVGFRSSRRTMGTPSLPARRSEVEELPAGSEPRAHIGAA